MSFWLVFVLVLGGVVLETMVVERILERWPQHGRWGINPSPVDCPRCGKRQPKARIPNSVYQALWGGWTCDSCGCEMDKYGNSKEARNSSDPS